MRIFSKTIWFLQRRVLSEETGPGSANSITFKTEMVKISNFRTYDFGFYSLKRLFTHFTAIKSPRQRRGLFIREMCKKSKSPPFFTKMSPDEELGTLQTVWLIIPDMWSISARFFPPWPIIAADTFAAATEPSLTHGFLHRWKIIRLGSWVHQHLSRKQEICQ